MRGAVTAALLSFSVPCHAEPPCAETIAALRILLGDAAFPLVWLETTMDDGKPLTMSIFERDGALFLSFVKAREGLWAEGAGAICGKADQLQTRFAADKLTIGPAAHWAMRMSLSGGGDFTLTRLDATRMKITTVGWSGTFTASD